nr:pogo transposable element with ZNF domain isoform X2 [Paramormyrops kingsleyae]
MADADLFMECEEEELEPWQKMNDDVEDEEVSTVESKATSVPDSVTAGPTSLASVPSSASPRTLSVSMATQMMASNATPSPTVQIHSNSTCSLSSVLPPAVGQPTVPSLVTQGLPKPAPGQQLILTQSPGGLGAVAMSHVLQPMQVMQGPAPGTSAATNQPIYFTTQGFPVQNVRPVQNPVNPLGIVLNVQPGQTVRPITLVSGTQFFKPAVGVPQVVSQPGPIRPGAPIAGRPASTTYTTVQIPATLTIRSNTPLSHPGAMGLATVVTSAATQPVHSSALPQNSQSKTVTPCGVVAVRHGDGTEVQRPPNAAPAISALAGTPLQAPPGILAKMASDGHTASAGSSPSRYNNMRVPPPASVPGSRLCPRCGAHFRMVEALRGHMCFCCPELTQNLSSTESPMSSGVGAAAVVRPTVPPPPQTKPIPPQNPSAPASQLGEGSPAGDTDPQGRLIMLVDEFYYGSYEGKRGHAPQDVTRESVQFKCLSCSKKLKNNIRLMNHMKHHMELEQQNGEVDTHTYCQHCYRQFPTPFQLQCHLESVHSNYESSTTCKICEWAFESEPAFLQHMKNTHKPGEMPYICQVCEYRSSYYSDVYNHFRTCHEDTKNLLCLYCLKVFKNSNSYQQHYIRHQKTVCYCNKCRLQFLFTKDKMDHKVNHHKTFRKPKQLEGLLPGTKVTIRAYAAQNKPTPGLPPAPLPAPPVRDAPSPVHSEGHQKQPLPQPPIKRKSVSKMLELLTKFQEQREVLGPQTCLECNYDVPDFANHFPTYVHCSICRYSTCCSRAYANHMINNHVPRKSTKYLALYRKPVPSWAKLTCSSCSYSTLLGDLMAKHLVQFPSHSYSLCSLKERLESDIECPEVEEDDDEEEPGGEAGSGGGDKPDWSAADSWGKPEEGTAVQEFAGEHGPAHSLAKNADAIDFFHLLFPTSFLDVIAKETNAFATYSQVMGQGDPDWVPVTVSDIQGFLGLSILMGLQSLPEIEMYWSGQHHDNWQTFLKTMAPERFRQIGTHFRVAGYSEDEQDYLDKLRLIRPILEVLDSTMWEAYKPKKCLTIDRALLPCLETDGAKERRSMGQPQVWLLCDSKSGYCHRLIVRNECRGQKKSKELGFRVVLPLLEGLQGKHHQVFLASSLTTVPLELRLLECGTYCSSSFPPESSIFPNGLWAQAKLDNPGDFLQLQCGPLLATRWKDSKEMCCLSTNAAPGLPDTVWRKSRAKAGELEPIERPQAFQLLQENMRGVDICNQLQACNPVGGLTWDTRWRCLLWFLLNLAVINSFIILRETMKESPPWWLEDGHFSQARYRKRLGFQLAKCAQRAARLHFSAARQAPSPPPGHRLVKVSLKTKRCKNCSLKNLRHESVFGCSECGVNLCKGDRCFREYHSLPARRKGPSTQTLRHIRSPKLGYVMERQRHPLPQNNSSSQPSVRPTLHTIPPASPSLHPPTNVGKDLDQETTPGKHLDVSLKYVARKEALPTNEQEASSKNATDASHGKELKPVSSASTVAPVKPAVDVAGRKEREENLSVRQLRIVLFALCCGIPQAAEHFSTQPQLIETWLLEKERQLRREGRPSSGGGGEAVDRLVEWVLAQREQQLPVTEKSLFQKASEIHRHANPSSSFRISYEWAVGFMLQNDLGLRPTDMVGRRLPWSMEDNAQGFTKFVHKQIQVQNFSPSVICAMDELSVFVDLDLLGNPVTVGKEAAFQLVGTGESLCDIFLAMLADGRLLPTMVFFKGQLPGRLRTNLPESILFEAKAEGFTEDEELELWISRVWQKYMNSQGESKAMLIMDPFRSHLSDVPLASFSAANTLPTVIPEGCTCRLQPLEMCVWPVLQAFLQARWTRLVAQGGAAGASDKDLVQLLMAWLVEALTCLKSLPDLLRRSFHVARVLPGMTGDAAPVEEQREMVCKLTEALLGPEALRTTSAAPRESETNSGPENESKLHGEDEEDGREVDKKQEAAGEVGMEVTEVQMNEEHLKKYEEFGAVLPPGSLVPANPQVLHQIFDKDSDAESFHGFDDAEFGPEQEPEDASSPV